MRRPVSAVIASLAVVLAVAVVALTIGTRDSAPDLRHRSTGAMHGMASTGEFDYLTHMVAHHQEAVVAARELRRSERAEMRAFGARVVATQSAQVRQMRTWLDRWYPQRSTAVPYRPMMRDLSGLSGDRLDRAFLTDMVPHHMMAVMMSQQLLRHGGADHAPVAALAREIRDEQHDEIVTMRGWLYEWFGASRMGPGTAGPPWQE